MLTTPLMQDPDKMVQGLCHWNYRNVTGWGAVDERGVRDASNAHFAYRIDTWSLTARASWSTLPSHSWLALPRSISSSEKNHGLRFEGILKFDLQGNRPSKAKNRQIR